MVQPTLKKGIKQFFTHILELKKIKSAKKKTVKYTKIFKLKN